MRTFTRFANREAKALLNSLLESPSHVEYRSLMERLGQEITKSLIPNLEPSQNIMLVCTNEDADFLGRGILSTLENNGFLHIYLACFWNDRFRLTTERDIAPIIRKYIEPVEKTDAFIVVKSIISSSCIVRTNIAELVFEKRPEVIFVVAPVILTGAMEILESEFDRQISDRFKYYYFAQDDESKDNGEVVPGIGGSVYELLGIGTSQTKNAFIPTIVKERRAKYHP